MEMNATEYLYGGLQISKNPEEAEHVLTGCTTKTSWLLPQSDYLGRIQARIIRGLLCNERLIA